MKVKIIKCSNKSFWYENEIGKIVDDCYLRGGWYITRDEVYSIRKQDAEAVEDVEKSCDNCKYDRYNTPNDMYCDEYAGLCDKYNKWQPVEVVAGVGQDAPKTGTTEEAKHYQVAEVQPINIMQDYMSNEQFIGFLLGNVIKYSLRINHKGKNREDAGKCLQYTTWLCDVMDGKKIVPGGKA